MELATLALSSLTSDQGETYNPSMVLPVIFPSDDSVFFLPYSLKFPPEHM